MSLKYKKVYIDTKYKTPDSISTSDFSIELPEVMLCPSNTVMYIDDISIPHSWTTIEPGINSRLYFFIFLTGNPSTNFSYIAYLSDGNYIGPDFAVEIQNKMNAAASQYVGLFTTAYDAKTNTIKISINEAGVSFYILTPKDLQDKLSGLFSLNYDTSKPCDCNEILSNLDGISKEYNTATPYISNYINMQPIRNIYMSSATLGNFQTVALRPRGYDNTIIKHIPVNSNFNEMIYCDTVVVNDWLDCSGLTLKKLDFKLMNSRSDVIPLHGVNMSFSLVFAKANSEF